MSDAAMQVVWVVGMGLWVLGCLTYAGATKDTGLGALSILAPFWPFALCAGTIAGLGFGYMHVVGRVADRLRTPPVLPSSYERAAEREVEALLDWRVLPPEDQEPE